MKLVVIKSNFRSFVNFNIPNIGELRYWEEKILNISRNLNVVWSYAA